MLNLIRLLDHLVAAVEIRETWKRAERFDMVNYQEAEILQQYREIEAECYRAIRVVLNQKT